MSLKKIAPFAFLGLIASVIVLLNVFKKEPVEVVVDDKNDDAPYVETYVVNNQQYKPFIDLYGQVKPKQFLDVKAKAGTQVTELLAKNGQMVKKGEPLAILVNDDLELQLAQTKARLSDIQGRLQMAKVNHENNLKGLVIEQDLLAISKQTLDRMVNLNKKSLSSSADIESAKRSYQNQKLSLNQKNTSIANFPFELATLEASENEIKQQLYNIEKDVAALNPVAEFDGQVMNIQVEKFEELQTNQTILTLVDQTQLMVEGYVALEQINASQLNDASLTVNGQSINLNLNSVDRLSQNGTVKVMFEINDENHNLVLNQFVSIKWPQPIVEDSVLVPASSVYENAFIYEINQDQELNRISVNVVGRSDNGWLVNSNENLVDKTLLVTRLPDASQSKFVNIGEPSNDDLETILAVKE